MRWIDQDPVRGRAEIEFDGVRRICHMACVPHARVGDFVIIHAGIAISQIDPDEAEKIFAELESLAEDDGWKGGTT